MTSQRAVDFGDRTLSQLFVPPSQINLCPCFSPVSNSTNLNASSSWLEDLNVGINIPSCDNLLCFSQLTMHGWANVLLGMKIKDENECITFPFQAVLIG